MQERHAEPQEYRRVLVGLEFPASKDAIVRSVADKGGHDREVNLILEQIDERDYDSVDDIMQEVERVYAIAGGMPYHNPAARPRTD